MHLHLNKGKLFSIFYSRLPLMFWVQYKKIIKMHIIKIVQWKEKLQIFLKRTNSWNYSKNEWHVARFKLLLSRVKTFGIETNEYCIKYILWIRISKFLEAAVNLLNIPFDTAIEIVIKPCILWYGYVNWHLIMLEIMIENHFWVPPNSMVRAKNCKKECFAIWWKKCATTNL